MSVNNTTIGGRSCLISTIFYGGTNPVTGRSANRLPVFPVDENRMPIHCSYPEGADAPDGFIAVYDREMFRDENGMLPKDVQRDLLTICTYFGSVSRAFGAIAVGNRRISADQVYSTMEAAIEELGVLSTFNKIRHSFDHFKANVLFHGPMTDRTLSVGAERSVDREHYIIHSVCRDIMDIAWDLGNAEPIARKILRKPSEQLKSFRAEALSMILISEYPGSFHGCTSEQAFEEYKTLASFQRDYYNTRGDVLLTRDCNRINNRAAVRQATNAMIERIARGVNNLPSQDTRTERRKRVGGYDIDVVIAYQILARLGSAGVFDPSVSNSARSSSAAFNNLIRMTTPDAPRARIDSRPGGGDPELTAVDGERMSIYDIVNAALEIVIECPLVIRDGTHCINLGDNHSRGWITNNVERSAMFFKCCTSCGTSLHNGNSVSVGTTFVSGLPPIPDTEEMRNVNMCTDCFRNAFVFAYDSGDWINRNRATTSRVLIESQDGERIGSINVVTTIPTRDTPSTNVIRCPHCNGNTSNDGLMVGTLFDGHHDEHIFRLLVAQGNSNARRWLESSRVVRLPRRISYYDSRGRTSEACSVCVNPNELYKSKKNGKLYLSVEDSPDAKDYGYLIEDPTGRFIDRCVGIEFETGVGSAGKSSEIITELNKQASDGMHIWKAHSDGSLMSGACEIVTPPLRCAAIPMGIDAMFSVAKKFKFTIENIRAGMHMHIDATDMMTKLVELRDAVALNSGPSMAEKRKLYNEIASCIVTYGDHVATVSRWFVSRNRRSNNYCNGGFGVRSWSPNYGLGGDPLFELHTTVNSNGRSAVCIHLHPGYGKRKKHTYTFENRIWPSTNKSAYVKARAEFTQRVLDRLFKEVINAIDSGSTEALRVLVSNFTSIGHQSLEERVSCVPKLVELFSLSGETTSAFNELHRRFWWVSHYAHEHNVDLNSQAIRELVANTLGASARNFSSDYAHEMTGLINNIPEAMADKKTWLLRHASNVSDYAMNDTIADLGEPCTVVDNDFTEACNVASH